MTMVGQRIVEITKIEELAVSARCTRCRAEWVERMNRIERDAAGDVPPEELEIIAEVIDGEHVCALE